MALSISNTYKSKGLLSPFVQKSSALSPFMSGTSSNMSTNLGTRSIPTTVATSKNSSLIPTKPKVAGTIKPPVQTPSSSPVTIDSLMQQANAAQSTINDLKSQQTTTDTSTPTPSNRRHSSKKESIKGMVPVTPYATAIQKLTNASTPSKTQTGLISDLRRAAEGNTAIGQNARMIADQYGGEIARVGKLGAGAVAGDLSTGSNVVGSGNAAIASQSASQRMNALAAGESAALQGTAQQLTGQNQLANTYNSALTGANTQQSNQISGLGSAAGYSAPNATGYGQTVFDPITGTFGGGDANLDPQAVASQLAQAVISGKKTYEQAVSSLGYAGGAGQQFLNNALQIASPGFNAPIASAQVAGQASVLGGVPALESAETGASGIKNKIVTYLAQNPQLNPSDLAVGNKLQQWIQGKQLADPKYQTLFNYLNEYTSTLAPILGVGGDATNLKTQIAQSFINASASGQSISQVLDSMQALAQGKIQDLRSGAVGGGVVSSPITGTGTGSGTIYDW